MSSPSSLKALRLMNSALLLELLPVGTCARSLCSVINRSCLLITLLRFFNAVPSMTLPQWKNVLRVSEMWQMDGLKESALASMEEVFTDQTAALKLRLARDYNMEAWKYPAIAGLVLRDDPLSENDIDVLGSKSAADIMQIRELDIVVRYETGDESLDSTTKDADEMIYELFGVKSPWLMENSSET
jgi:hypothetical protein